MSLQQAIRERLLSQAKVTAIIVARIFPEARQQDSALPCLVYGINNEVGMPTLAGTAMWKAEIEIVAVAATKSASEALAIEVINALDGFAGTLASTVIMHCLHSRSVTAYQAPIAGEANGLFLHTTVFSTMHKG